MLPSRVFSSPAQQLTRLQKGQNGASPSIEGRRARALPAELDQAAVGVRRSAGASVRFRTRALAISASTDQGPGPTAKRKITLMSWAYSDRTSCSTAQIPICGGTGGNGSGDVPR